MPSPIRYIKNVMFCITEQNKTTTRFEKTRQVRKTIQLPRWIVDSTNIDICREAGVRDLNEALQFPSRSVHPLL